MPDKLLHANPTALEHLALEKTVEAPLLGQPEGGKLGSQCCSGTSIPEDSPEEDTFVQNQPEGKTEAQPAQDIALFPVYMRKLY